MILISHRGNLNRIDENRENSPDYLIEALKKGYDVELDIWNIDGYWKIGHDKPLYDFNFDYFNKYLNCIWFHCKNIDAYYNLVVMKENNKFFNFFWHQNDDFTLTSNNKIWTFPGKKLTKFSICVLPEQKEYIERDLKSCYGICSDFIEKYRNYL